MREEKLHEEESDNLKPVLTVDARGLEPPQPLVTILEALGQLPAGGELRARTDRKPMHLYSFLIQRGFLGESQEEPDGSWLTTIKPAPQTTTPKTS